jgi:hypothetical protein
MTATPGKIRFPGLPLGAANTSIYKDLLGYSKDKIRKMKTVGLI